MWRLGGECPHEHRHLETWSPIVVLFGAVVELCRQKYIRAGGGRHSVYSLTPFPVCSLSFLVWLPAAMPSPIIMDFLEPPPQTPSSLSCLCSWCFITGTDMYLLQVAMNTWRSTFFKMFLKVAPKQSWKGTWQHMPSMKYKLKHSRARHRRQRQVDFYEFKVNLVYLSCRPAWAKRPCLKIK